MRKLLLFGLLGGVFGVALLLERLFSKPEPQAALAANKAVWVLGGGVPREIPDEPPDDGSKSERTKESGSSRSRGEQRAQPRKPDPDELDPAPAPIDLEDETQPVSYHVVAADETLSSIARAKLGSTTRWKDLARWNGIDDPATLKKGTRLRLAPPQSATAKPAPRSSPSADVDAAAPRRTDPPRTHRVAKGETLSKISARYLGSAQRWREIQRLNGNVDPANVAEGTVLRIPER